MNLFMQRIQFSLFGVVPFCSVYLACSGKLCRFLLRKCNCTFTPARPSLVKRETNFGFELKFDSKCFEIANCFRLACVLKDPLGEKESFQETFGNPNPSSLPPLWLFLRGESKTRFKLLPRLLQQSVRAR